MRPEATNEGVGFGFLCSCQLRVGCSASEKTLLFCLCSSPPSGTYHPVPALQSRESPGSLPVCVAIGLCCCLRLPVFVAVGVSARWMKARSDLLSHATSSSPLLTNFLQVWLAAAVAKVPIYMAFTDLVSLSFKQGMAGGHPCCYFLQLIRCNSCSAAVQRWQHWQLTGRLPSTGKYLGLHTQKNWDMKCENIWCPVSVVILSVQTNRTQSGNEGPDSPAVQLGDELFQWVWHAGLTWPRLRYSSDRVCILSKMSLLNPFCTILSRHSFFFTLMFTKAAPANP